MKTVFVGKEGSGKTLLMGRETERLIYRNVHFFKKTGVMRPIVSNIAYSAKLVDFARSKGVPMYSWQHIEELERMTECDLFIDEVGAYFDSRTFDSLPLSTRLWLAQAQKLGVHIFAGAQDWAQIDVSFRRLVNQLFAVDKIIGSRRPSKSLPGSKHPWAIAVMWQLEPASDSDSTESKSMQMFPTPLFFSRKDAERFDTNARVRESAPPPLKKIVRVCAEDGYKRVRYV